MFAGVAAALLVSMTLLAADADISREDAKKLKSPAPFTQKSIANGKQSFSEAVPDVMERTAKRKRISSPRLRI
ncbi:MAG TPA: hypothetical protein VGG72_31325 [Bryobacteraceae bacterium]|jgi:hypothetical protein